MPVQYTRAARDALATMPDKFRAQIVRRADALGANPHPPGAKKLQGVPEATYRVRQGAYRILYVIRAGQVVIVSIGARREVYR